MARGSLNLQKLFPQIPLLISLVLLLDLFLTTQQAEAYVTNGARWPGQPTSGCCANQTYWLDPNITSYDSNGWAAGKSAWNSSIANILFNSVSSSSSANIRLTSYWNSTDNYCGYSSWTDASFSNAYGYLNDYWSYGQSTGRVQSCSTHELGHLSSLDHPSVSSCASGTQGAIMYSAPPVQYDACGWNTPRTDDINGVNAQY